VLYYNITIQKKNQKKSHLGVDLWTLWPYTVRTIRATEEGNNNIKDRQVDPPAGNVKRKPDTGVQYTPGAWRFTKVVTSWNHWQISNDTIRDPPAPPNLLIILENLRLNTKEQSPTRIPPSAIVLSDKPLYNTRNKQEARPSKFQRFQRLRLNRYSSVRA